MGRPSGRYVIATFLLLLLRCRCVVVRVNVGYFREPAGHLWTYGVDAHSWTDDTTNTTYSYVYWPQTSGAKVVKKLQSGELDLSHGGNSPWANGVTRGVKAKMIYVIHSKDESQVLVSHRGIRTPQELLGKRVAYVSGSTTHYMLEGLAAQARLDMRFMEDAALLSEDERQRVVTIIPMSQAEQTAAWDRGDIDAGFMWGAGMRHLQENPWCASPDPSSSLYRPCDEEGAGNVGYDLYTAGVSKRWDRETWNCLAVTDAFAAMHARAVYRFVKVISTMDTQLLQDKSFFTQSQDRLCTLAKTSALPCDIAGLGFTQRALSFDQWLDAATQQSSEYMGERQPGQCDLESVGEYPNFDGPCNKLTMSGMAWSTWATAQFAYMLKQIPFLPSFKYYQDTLDEQYINDVGSADELFPGITAETLAPLPDIAASPGTATNFCGDMMQPIALDVPGVVSDHEGIGHYQEDHTCVWQISQPNAVLISDINIRIERAQDVFLVYEGLCDDCTDFPLLAKYTGGKGTSDLTLENLNPRPPVWISTGQATVRFVPDGTEDVPLLLTVDDGISFRWDRAGSSSGQCSGLSCMNGGICEGGACQCINGWSGADCSFPSCIGTRRLTASDATATFQSNVDSAGIGYDADCRWIITAEDQSKVVALEFLELDTDWLYDVVTVHAGESTAVTLATYSGFDSPMLAKEVGHKCPGDNCPGLLVSPGSSVLVRFTSNSIESGSGFRIGYRSVDPDEARCGIVDFADCSGNGNCTDAGCACNEGWFGAFCQSRECMGRSVLPTAASGRVRNAAEGVSNYAPLLDCQWVVTAPLRNNDPAGAIAFWFRSFSLEVESHSTDTLRLAGAGVEGVRFTGAALPCITAAACSSDSDCSGGTCVSDTASCQATGNATNTSSSCVRSCSCPATIILGDEVTLEFVTDFNNYPADSSFSGFVLEYEALYDCHRNESTGHCIALDRCTELEEEAGDLGCQDCPSNMYFDKAFLTCRCEAGYYPVEEGDVRCMPCELGTYAQDRGSLECVKCPPGFYGERTGLVQCTRCDLGTFADQSGASACTECPGEKLTTQSIGSYDVGDCVCGEGTYRPAYDRLTCLGCPDRMVCAFGADEMNFGNANASEGRVAPEVEEAFFAEADHPLSVYRCRNILECPGGPPGTCQANRMGLGCGMCEPWFVPSKKDGTCKPCGVGGIAPGILAILLAVFAMSGLVIFSRVDVSQTKLNTLTVAIIVGQLVVTAQFLSLFNSLSVTWVEPVRTFMSLLAVVSFDLEVLNLGCTVPEENHALVFVLKLMIFPVLALLLLFLAYILSCWERRPFEIHRLINSIGLLFMTLYLTLSMVAVEPFQCTSSPNGTSSITNQPAVLCGANPAYIWTACFGVVAVLTYPVGFFSWVAYICYHYPQMISSGNGHIIINRYRFLFQRFRADCFYYAPVYLLRNFLIALLPALYPDHGHRQIIGFVFLLLVFGNIQGWLRPWRGTGANMLDSVITLCIVMVLLGGALLIDSEAAQVSSDLQFFLAAVLTVMGVSFVCIFLYLMYLRFFPKKTYLAFLSHHKQGCGAGARLMKIELEGRTGKHVFLDSDELESLENLFDIVRLNTGKLVLLLTAETLSRPWCAGEIACAWKNGVPIICVRYDDYAEPTDEELTLDGLRSKWSAEAFAEVELQGIFLTDVQEAFSYIRSSEKIHMPRLACSISGELAELEKAVADVIAKVDGKPPSVPTTTSNGNVGFKESETASSEDRNQGSDEGHIVVLANGDNGEAISTAQVLARMLQKVTQQTAIEIVNQRELEAVRAKENHVTHLLVVLTPGALTATAFSRILVAALKCWPRAFVTTVKCMDFCFPSKAELEQLIFNQVAQDTGTSREVVRTNYNTVLACLAMPFTPHGHISVLTAEVERISRRLESRAKAKQGTPPVSGAMARSSTRAWSMSRKGPGAATPTSDANFQSDPQAAADQELTLYQAHSTSSALVEAQDSDTARPVPRFPDNASGTASKELAGQVADSGSEGQGDRAQDAVSASPSGSRSATRSKASSGQAGRVISDAARASEVQANSEGASHNGDGPVLHEASFSGSSGPPVRGEPWQEPNGGSAAEASGGPLEWQAANSGSAAPESTGPPQWQAANSGSAAPEGTGPPQWQEATSAKSDGSADASQVDKEPQNQEEAPNPNAATNSLASGTHWQDDESEPHMGQTALVQ